MNTPTEREKQIITDTRIRIVNYLYGRMKDPIRRFEEDELDLIILAAIQDAKQQGNEDTARLDWLHINGIQALLNVPMRADMREWLDAARGVQPAAKEPVQIIGDDFVIAPAARQESAPACPKCGAYQDLQRNGKCPSCGHRYEPESAPAAEQRGYAQLAKRLAAKWIPLHPSSHLRLACQAAILEALHGAPSPAQDKPVAASVEKWAKAFGPNDECVQIGGTTFTVNISAQLVADKINSALSASSPSEQKSSLPAETLSAQEQENEETGNA